MYYIAKAGLNPVIPQSTKSKAPRQPKELVPTEEESTENTDKQITSANNENTQTPQIEIVTSKPEENLATPVPQNNDDNDDNVPKVKDDSRYKPWFKKLKIGAHPSQLSIGMKALGLNPDYLATPDAPAPPLNGEPFIQMPVPSQSPIENTRSVSFQPIIEDDTISIPSPIPTEMDAATQLPLLQTHEDTPPAPSPPHIEPIEGSIFFSNGELKIESDFSSSLESDDDITTTITSNTNNNNNNTTTTTTTTTNNNNNNDGADGSNNNNNNKKKDDKTSIFSDSDFSD